MKARILSLVLASFLLLSVFTGCSSKNRAVTTEQAQKIAIETAGLSASQVTNIHTHIITQEGIPCYNVHITAGEQEYSFIISAADGSILSSGNETGH